MSDSSQVRISLVAESTPGTTPASPAMLVLPCTGQSLRDAVQYVESALLSSGRNVKDLVRVNRSSGGGLPSELTFSATSEALYLAIRASLASGAEAAQVTLTNAGAGIACVAGEPDTITRTSGSFVTDGFAKNDIVRVDAEDPADSGYRLVTDVTASTLTLEGSTFTGSDASVTRGARLTNGTTKYHYSVEVSRLDIGKHQVFKKQVFGSMELNIASGAISTIAFNLTGGLSAPADSAVGASYTDPAANDVMDSVNVPFLLIGGNEYEVTSIRLATDNQARSRTKLGTDAVGSIAFGRMRVTGTLSNYKQDNVELNKYLTNQSSSLAFVQEDGDGAAWAFVVPKIKFSEVSTPTTGNDSDEIEQLNFQGILSDDGNYTLLAFRFTA